MSRKKVNAGPHSDTQYSVFWDESIGKYVQYTRAKVKNPEQARYFRERYSSKVSDADQVKWRDTDLWVGRAVSDDFINWSKEELVFGPDESDRGDEPGGVTRVDFYGGNIRPYDEAPGVYIGLPNAYGHWKYDITRKWWGGGGQYIQLPSTMDAQLITSRDGVNWNRPPRRRPFIGLGPEGTFWSRQIYPDGNAFRVGNELWFYFAGLDVHHKEQSLRESHGARGRAVLRLDGFISADSDYTGGELTTRPLIFSGGRLRLNLATNAGGVVKVEILKENGQPIQGFSEAEADEINGNHTRLPASWSGAAEVSSLAGRPVKLRFIMSDAKLYSFQFITEN